MPELLEAAQVAEQAFDLLWLTEGDGLSRHCWTLLTLVASRTRMSVGPCVSHPLGQNPLQMASVIATLGEFMGAEREVVLGFGTGGGGPRQLYEHGRILTRTREFVLVLQRLLRGERFEAGEYPTLPAFSGFRPSAVLQLTVPLGCPVSIVLTGTGPNILRMAGELADGVLCASNFPAHSYAAFASEAFPTVSNLSYLETGLRTRSVAAFRRIYGINVSVAEDGEAARAYARRQAAIIIRQERDKNLAQIGIDVEALRPVRAAFASGLSHEEAARQLPEAAADALVVSGTPPQCIPRIQELKEYAERAGFNEFYIGSPLGPDPVEAVRLLVREVVPRVWKR